METKLPITPEFIREANAPRLSALEDDYGSLGRQLRRRGIDIEKIERQVAAFSVALPSWGAGRGGTRFAKFPFRGAPTNIHEKLEDCSVVQQLCRITPRVSPHFPWDCVSDYRALREQAAALGLAFDAVNSNTFQDQPGQQHSYASGSLTSTDRGAREQALAHNIDCINIGRELGSTAITVWLGDGSNFPGQQDLTRAFDRYLESMAQIYTALPGGWRMLLEHKLYEPAFYSTVLQDWGSSILAAQQLGPKAQCLVDLGHHAPDPDHRAGPQGQERDGRGRAQGQVGVQDVVHRVNLEDHVGGDHAEAREQRDDEACRDGPLGAPGGGRVLRVGRQLALGRPLGLGQEGPGLRWGRCPDHPVRAAGPLRLPARPRLARVSGGVHVTHWPSRASASR